METKSSQTKIQLFVDDASQPSRAWMAFWELNNIPYEKVPVIIFKGGHLSQDYKKINPMQQVPAMKDGDFILAQSHAILKYLHSSRHCPDHWYPADLIKRAKVDAYLDWHHWFLRQGAGGFIFKTLFAPKVGMIFSESDIENSRLLLDKSLKTIETVFLTDSKYICGNEITIADLSCFWELTQLGFIEEDLTKYPNLNKWYNMILEMKEIQKVSEFVHLAIKKTIQKMKAKM